MIPLAKDTWLSSHSKRKLRAAHHDLKAVVYRASAILKAKGSHVDFRVGEVDRSVERQRELKAAGASRTMNSRHIVKPLKENGEWVERAAAVDLIALIGGKVSWDWPPYYVIADAMKQAAQELGVPIEWGGDWRSFKDGPHYQLPWRKYPVKRS